MNAKRVVLAAVAVTALAAVTGCDGSRQDRAAQPPSQSSRDTLRPPDSMAANPATGLTPPGRQADQIAPGPMAEYGSAPSGTGAAPSNAARPDDETITKNVKAALIAEAGLAGAKVDVKTSDGRVTLKGDVPKDQVDHVIQIARNVDGVQEVVNQLRSSGAV